MNRAGIVFVQNMRAGLITETDTGYEFYYENEYLEKEDSLAVSLTLPLSREIYKSNTLFPFFFFFFL